MLTEHTSSPSQPLPWSGASDSPLARAGEPSSWHRQQNAWKRGEDDLRQAIRRMSAYRKGAEPGGWAAPQPETHASGDSALKAARAFLLMTEGWSVFLCDYKCLSKQADLQVRNLNHQHDCSWAEWKGPKKGIVAFSPYIPQGRGRNFSIF